MTANQLLGIRSEGNALRQNRLLFDALRDDTAREALYEELRQDRFRPLAFKSVIRHGGGSSSWPDVPAFLLTSAKDVSKALQHGSVKPYSELDSGGRFMLGLDDRCPHMRQRQNGLEALDFDAHVLDKCACEAVVRAMVLPTKNREFDLVTDVAEQAAVRYIAILFGLRAKSHVLLERAMRAGYIRLTFQIIGRHFVSDDGLPPSESKLAVELRDKLEADLKKAVEGTAVPEWWDHKLLRAAPAAVHLGQLYRDDPEMARVVVKGLMAGTVGNITSAIANVFDHFFRAQADGSFLVDEASALARRKDGTRQLNDLIREALRLQPAAPFLARTTLEPMAFGEGGATVQVPAGAELLLAMGAETPIDLDLMFGGNLQDKEYPHSCVGRHLAWPLVERVVREVLLLPGLTRRLDPDTREVMPPVRRWGAIWESFPLQFQRDRRLNQQPLLFVLKIKEPVAENAQKLMRLTRAGAAVVERALQDASNVHFAWFMLIENSTHLAFFTVYDGDFDAYVEHFALKVPLFDKQFEFLEDAPPTPIQKFPKEFVDTIRKYNRKPLAGYFYSAYPRSSVADIHNEGLAQS
ncbi:hypothetical protein QTI17_01985 [Variovorax sp. J31P179]|uniref:hypothetical protein n=1 Tax=Variovorax sp. J31P179 TaxID=3053508 RepID=UPI00257585FB|nr:hypothetical protein [Variovorax sp. J31P179]MDM0079351.1 hypothetical protein [Variovorax sp. J31P179]